MSGDGAAGPRGSAWWHIPLYPAAIPVALVLQAWAAAAIHPAAMYRSLVVAVVFSLVLTLVVAAVSRSRDLGGLAAAGILVAIIAASVPATSLVVLLAVALIVLLGLVRRGRPWPLGQQISRGMNIVGGILLLASVINLVQTGAAAQGLEDIQLDLAGRGPIGTAAADAPDIYLILLDGYPGADARALLPDYPASHLRDDLVSRGFDMVADTHSNYLQTTTTLASMLQMRHLQGLPELAPPWGPEPFDSRRLRRLINDAPALDRLHDAGYTTTAIASGFAEVELRRVDTLFDAAGPTEFEISLMRGTGVGRALEALAPDLVPAAQRGRIDESVAALEAIPSSPADRPRFVLAHIPAPHPPWVFAADGSGVRESVFVYYTDSAKDRQIERSEALRRHLDQAAYVDGLIVKAIDRILADSASPPVIVLFSDHGPGTGFDHLQPLASDLVERTSNVLAAYTPGQPGLFAEATTPITILPRLLDTYVGQDVPEPDDSVWAWRESKLDFVPVDLDAQP